MIVVLFGPPGSGKGTQASGVARQLSIPHVSTGEILRAEVASGSSLGGEVGPIMDRGQLISDELMVRVIEARLAHPDATEGVLLDGFPRTVPQARELDSMLVRHGATVDLVVAFEVPEDLLLERILNRGRLDGRADDTLEAFIERIEQYHRDTEPVLDYYRAERTFVAPVNGVGTVEEVSERITAIIPAKRRGVA